MSTNIKRRNFLKGTAVAGAAAAAAVASSSFPAPAIAQGKRQLKMVTTWPKNFPGLGTGAQRFADRITNGTEGRIEVKLYAAGELVPPFESFDAVSQGTADMYHTPPSITGRASPRPSTSSAPFLSASPQARSTPGSTMRAARNSGTSSAQAST